MQAVNHTGNIILSICGKKIDSDMVKRRLAKFYSVSVDAIMHTSSPTIDTYLIEETRDAYGLNWYYKDDVSFTASAYPVIDAEVLNAKGGKSIKNLLSRSKGEFPDLWKITPPFALFSHHLINDSLTCFNDFIGTGRIYTYSKESLHIVASTPLAIALVSANDLIADENFWDAYYTYGGAIGNRTYYKGITLTPGGNKVVYNKGRLVSKEIYSYMQALLLEKNNELPYGDSVESCLNMMNAVRSYLPDNFKIGVSGGRDSRLLAALAIKAGLDFKPYTSYPPALEAEVAKRLFDSLDTDYHWEAKLHQAVAHIPQQPILERAEKWFCFSFGESWAYQVKSDYRMSNINSKKNVSVGFSGVGGEKTRSIGYNSLDRSISEHLDRAFRGTQNSRAMLPRHMKLSAIEQYKATLVEPMMAGISDYYLVDYAHTFTKTRRFFPNSTVKIMPLFTPELVVSSFWMPSEDKVSGKFLADLTAKLVPQWKDIKFMHELTEGTDPNLTNKTHVSPTYWETDRDDFFDSIKYVIDNINSAELTMASVEKNISELPEGRPRTSQTYEVMFWRAGFHQTMNKINEIRRTF
jgi:hypothetical protein